MAQKKRKKTTRCTANGVPLAAKLARDRMLREAMQSRPRTMRPYR